jgi:hypothetical protein
VAWNPFRRKAEPERGRGDSSASSTGTGPHASEDEQTASWRELATLITPDAGLVDVVLLAHRSPAEYLRMHATAAENRGLEDDDVDPWFALVDWLIENEFAHELDWKEVFDVDSDSYPVVLVETKRRDRIVALAQTLGHRVDVMTLERARHEGGRGYTGDIEL